MRIYSGRFTRCLSWWACVGLSAALTGCNGSTAGGESTAGTGPGGDGGAAGTTNGGAAGTTNGGAAGTTNGGAAGTTTGGSSSGGSAGQEPEGTRFWEDTEGDMCPTVSRPSAAQRPPAGGGGDQVVYLVMNQVDLGDGGPAMTGDQNAWKGIGFNLDRSCNTATWPDGALSGGQVSTCPQLKDKACKNELQDNFDGEYCRDNALGNLFALARLSPAVGDPFRLNGGDWNCALRQGSMGIVFKISDYNGNLNDDQVRLDVYSSTGVTQPANWNCRTGPSDSDPLDPSWPHQAEIPRAKTFQVADRDLASPPSGGEIPASKWADPSAYVRAGWLVASLPESTELWFSGLSAETPGLRFVLNHPVIAARLEQDSDGRWLFSSATLGATSKPSDMITSFREIGFCENLCDSYTTTLGYLSQGVDMLSSSFEPMPDQPCDALSFGMAFSAKQYDNFQVVSVPPPPDVSGGKCGAPRNPDVPEPGCTCQPGQGCVPQ